MTATALPDIDRSALEDLRKRLPDLSEIELTPPRMEHVGRKADEAVDRLLGRSRAPMWPRVLAAVGLIAILGLLAAWITWGRRPGWGAPSEEGLERSGSEDPTATGAYGSGTGLGMGTGFGAGSDAGMQTEPGGDTATGSVAWDRPEGTGLTAAEASLTSTRDTDEPR